MTPKTLDFKLSVLLLREGEVWVAQCLEYDIAAQGKTIPAVKELFARTFAGQVFADLHNQTEPLSGFSQAPRKYWDQFKQAERLAKQPKPVFQILYELLDPGMAKDEEAAIWTLLRYLKKQEAKK